MSEAEVAAAFALDGRVAEVSSHGTGNVHDTFLVSVGPEPARSGQGSNTRYILQRINDRVFPRPDLISQNIRVLHEHVPNPQPEGHDLRFPAIVQTLAGDDYLIDDEGGFWRCQEYVENAVTHPDVLDETHAFEVGQALGRFHRIASGIDVDRLHETLAGFHVTPGYVESYDRSLQTTLRNVTDEAAASCVAAVSAQRAGSSVLADALHRGDLLRMPIHGDPKVDNVLIDTDTQRAVSIIDLDTFQPGLVQYDIGDCLRSSCNRLGDETDRPDEVTFDVDLCRSILSGYLPIARDFLRATDYEYIYESVRLIAFELGLRFFTDYLDGDVYFKVSDDEHNLRRALVQFQLVRSIEAQQDRIESVIADCLRRG